MRRFSPGDAALEGFRITRENPRAFWWWAAVAFLVSVAGVFVTVLMPPNVRNAVETLRAEETPDLATFANALINVAPLFVFGLAFQAMMAAAIYRLIFRHSDARYGYLRLGGDELRLMAVIVLFVLIAILVAAGLTFVAAIVIAIASMAGRDLAVWLGVLTELVLLPAALFSVFVWGAMAMPATFAQRRIRIREALSLMRPVFWRLAGAYLIAFACMATIGILVLFLFSALAGVVVLLMGGQLADLSNIFHPDETSFRAYLNVGMIAYMIVGSLFNTLFNAAITAPGAMVYRHQHDDPDALSVHGYTS